jgi:hypothetical protein
MDENQRRDQQFFLPGCGEPPDCRVASPQVCVHVVALSDIVPWALPGVSGEILSFFTAAWSRDRDLQ